MKENEIEKYLSEEDKEKMEEGSERFVETGEYMRVVFKPQCTECINNINYQSCLCFEEKPEKYMKNKEKCESFIKG